MGNKLIVTNEMKDKAKTYFVLSKSGINMKYIGPKNEYQKWYYIMNKEYKNRKAKEWRINNLEHDKERSRIKGYKYRYLEKLNALRIVSGNEIPCCNKCGINDIRILTLNHINGDGNEDRRDNRACDTYRKVLNGRNTSDLEVLCYNCNILYEYEISRRSLPLNYKKLAEI